MKINYPKGGITANFRNVVCAYTFRQWAPGNAEYYIRIKMV